METVAVAEQKQFLALVQGELSGCSILSPSYIDREKIPEKKIWLTQFRVPKDQLEATKAQAKACGTFQGRKTRSIGG